MNEQIVSIAQADFAPVVRDRTAAFLEGESMQKWREIKRGSCWHMRGLSHVVDQDAAKPRGEQGERPGDRSPKPSSLSVGKPSDRRRMIGDVDV